MKKKYLFYLLLIYVFSVPSLFAEEIIENDTYIEAQGTIVTFDFDHSTTYTNKEEGVIIGSGDDYLIKYKDGYGYTDKFINNGNITTKLLVNSPRPWETSTDGVRPGNSIFENNGVINILTSPPPEYHAHVYTDRRGDAVKYCATIVIADNPDVLWSKDTKGPLICGNEEFFNLFQSNMQVTRAGTPGIIELTTSLDSEASGRTEFQNRGDIIADDSNALVFFNINGYQQFTNEGNIKINWKADPRDTHRREQHFFYGYVGPYDSGFTNTGNITVRNASDFLTVREMSHASHPDFIEAQVQKEDRYLFRNTGNIDLTNGLYAVTVQGFLGFRFENEGNFTVKNYKQAFKLQQSYPHWRVYTPYTPFPSIYEELGHDMNKQIINLDYTFLTAEDPDFDYNSINAEIFNSGNMYIETDMSIVADSMERVSQDICDRLTPGKCDQTAKDYPAYIKYITYDLWFNQSDVNQSMTLTTLNDLFVNTGSLYTSHPIHASLGEDTFIFGGDRTDTCNSGLISFEIIKKQNSGTWTLGGEITGTKEIYIEEGELNLNGRLEIDESLEVKGNINLHCRLALDINDTSKDIVNIDIDGAADIRGSEFFVKMPKDTNLSTDWKKTILRAESINGELESFFIDASQDLLIGYENNDIILLTLDVNRLSSCAALNPSENVAALIDKLEQEVNADAATNSLLIQKLYSMEDTDKLCDSLKSLSPEPLASAAAGGRANLSSHIKNISDRLKYYHIPKQTQNNLALLISDNFGILNLNDSPTEDSESLWISQSYVNSNRDSDPRHIGYELNGLGTSIGKDYIAGNLLFGISGGYSNTDIQYNTDLSDGDVTTYNMSVYGSYTTEKYYIDSILTYSNHNYDINRIFVTSDIYNPYDAANANWHAYQYDAYIEAGYKIPLKNNFLLMPTINFEYSRYAQNGFAEQGSISNFETHSASYDSFISGIGLSIGKMFDYKDWTLQPYASFMLKHNFSDTTDSLRTEFSDLSNDLGPFTISGYDQGKNNYNLSLGIRTYSTNNFQIYFDYNLAVKSESVTHGLSLGFKFYF